ncbi:PD-(D/E)XK nuclease family protein [Intrasporangium calvum]|uniref:PD-(D/E)XK nuclease family protein n=1 Tax=Intrasporangium calvum TaxID=53358 RepID=A0ABT5GF57_9MICO|nr:PD-(D/E)XK nuclease family protein [Intrasporangium calvum]MDC5696883.1 PD-(D/E)XK nuclease family protein [Intrasporangium calvum]
MSDDLVTQLLPTLTRSLDVGFNVFDVMRHGTHEKQISNVFRWLLDANGTHGLGEAFADIFIAEVNRNLAGVEPLEAGGYWVRQEVNIAEESGGVDIADLVLESKSATLVIENYGASDGHGHGYEDYLQYSRRDGQRGAVVMLCHQLDRSRLTKGWENAAIVTYRSVLDSLREAIAEDREYQGKFPEAYSLIDQMHRKFVKGRGPVEDRQVLDFVVAMCETGEAARYSKNNIDQVTEQFASDLHEQARERFGEGRTLLQRVKDRLKAFSSAALKPQLDAAGPSNLVGRVAANYSGKWRWEVILPLETTDGTEDDIQLIFGPSAWHAQLESAPAPLAHPDYSRIFIWRHSTKQFRQSAVTLQEVLDGLNHEDTRLRDEILELLDHGR